MTSIAEAAPQQRTVTIREASDATGLSVRAIRSRVDRGTLPAVVRDGLRRIPYSELLRLDLVEAGNGASMRQEQPRSTSTEAASTDGVILELSKRLELQAAELGEMRAITRQAETLGDQHRHRVDELEAELLEARAKVIELEQQQQAERRPRRDPLLRRRWLRRR